MQGIRRGSSSKNKEQRKPRVNTPNENKIPLQIGANLVQKNLLFKSEVPSNPDSRPKSR